MPGLVQAPPRLLVVDLADHVFADSNEGVPEVAVGGGGHERGPSWQPGLERYLLLCPAAVLDRDLEINLLGPPVRQMPVKGAQNLYEMAVFIGAEPGAES